MVAKPARAENAKCNAVMSLKPIRSFHGQLKIYLFSKETRRLDQAEGVALLVLP